VSETTIATLLTALQREPGRPRLTWYGDDFERVELSGAVLENWVHKTANLLVEEFDAGPGTRVRLDLPGHWRTVVWALSVWRVGACVVLGPAVDPVDVLVTSDPASVGAGEQVVVVTLPALARRAPGPLPSGAIDAAAAVMTYGDVLAWAPELDPTARALDDDGAATAHRELAAWAGDAAGERTLVVLGDDEPAASLRTTLAVLLAGGSVVLAVPGAVADPAARERLLAGERVTSAG
jgi:uncharacterized protein (TIGR03089 family)